VLLKYETNLNKYLIVRLDLCLGIIKECNVRLIYNIQCSSPDCHYISYWTCHIIPNIYAPIRLTFYPLLKTKTGSTRCKQTLEVKWTRRKTVHIIGIEQIQTGSDPFHHVKHSRSATATERNWDVTETFLSVWTSPFDYTWENFTESLRSATEQKRDV